MTIPKQFNLYGETIKVKYSSKLNKHSMGQALFSSNIIHIATNIQHRDKFEQTYIHELLHFVLFNSRIANKYKFKNGKRLYMDENFVDDVSALLHQAIKSSKGYLKHKK